MHHPAEHLFTLCQIMCKVIRMQRWIIFLKCPPIFLWKMDLKTRKWIKNHVFTQGKWRYKGEFYLVLERGRLRNGFREVTLEVYLRGWAGINHTYRERRVYFGQTESWNSLMVTMKFRISIAKKCKGKGRPKSDLKDTWVGCPRSQTW